MASSSASSAAAETSCVRAVQFYVNKILRPRDRAREVTGMKCLLLDRDTKGIVSMVFSMGELLQRDVFLVETLDAKHEALGHLKAVCLLRPTPANVKELCRHLREPKFLEYHVFFTNILPQDMLRSLADADHLSVVKQVHECYADFFAQAPDLFSLSLSGSLGLSRPKELYAQADELNLKRCASGLVALLLSLKIKRVRRACLRARARAHKRDRAGIRGSAGAPADRRSPPPVQALRALPREQPGRVGCGARGAGRDRRRARALHLREGGRQQPAAARA